MPSRQANAAPPWTSSISGPYHPLRSNHGNHENIIFGFAVGGGVAAFVAVILLFFILYHRFRSSKTSPDDLSTVKLQRYSYRELKAATQRFSSDRKLGQGGFGAVYKGLLRHGQEVAVKKLDTTSLQGEREFRNELCVIGNVSSPHIVGLLGFCADGKKRLLVYEYMHNRSLQEALFDDSYPVSLNWDKRFKIILDTAHALAFLHTKCDPVIVHGDIKPSNILLDSCLSARIADFGLARLKTDANGPDVRSEDAEGQSMERERIRSEREALEKERRQRKKDTAGKVKKQEILDPEKGEKDEVSNGVVLGNNSLGKDSPSEVTTSPTSEDPSVIFSSDQQEKNPFDCQEREREFGDDGSYRITNVLDHLREKDELGSPAQLDSLPGDTQSESPGSLEIEIRVAETGFKSPDVESVKESHREQRSTDMSKEEFEVDDKTSQSEGYLDKMSIDSVKELQFVGVKCKERKKGSFGRDWWWRQESSGELSVKEYVMEWMGNDGRREKQRSNLSWREENAEDESPYDTRMKEKRDRSRSSEWWGSVHDEFQLERQVPKKEKKDKSKGRECREWWKEEYCAELSSKSKEMKRMGVKTGISASLEWWRDDASESGSTKSKKWKKQRNKSKDWWKDEEQGKEVRGGKERRRERSLSREWWSGDILSRGVSSTPSMRGTICYVAPEYGGGGILSEKSDVYSFGVLLLVIVSGRRPLQVTASPLTELERANLISWARQLAQSGNVLDLVDATLNGEYDKDQALLCITVALLCLQRLPAVRPNMIEVVKILLGELEVPSLPFEFSPSPPNGVPFKSRRHHLSSDQVSVDFPLLA